MASGLVSYMRAGGLQTFPGCAEPGPAQWHLKVPTRSRPSGQQGTPVEERPKGFLGKWWVTSVELSPGHVTLGFSVPWGRGGYHQATNSEGSNSPGVMEGWPLWKAL